MFGGKLYAHRAAVAFALLTLLVPSAGAHALGSADARCRYTLGKATEKLVRTVLVGQEKCRKLRAKGALPPATDCADSLQLPNRSAVERAANRVLTQTVKRCAGASSPAALGYATCPAPCGGAIADFTDVSVCATCLARHGLAEAGSAAVGTPPTPPAGSEAITCQAAIGRALRTEFSGILRDQQRCQLQDDFTPLGVDCRTADYTGGRATATRRAERLLTRCTAPALGNLASCAATPDSLAACLNALTAQQADRLFTIIYRPFDLLPPSPTPTPSNTPTPTLTATASATATASITATATWTATRTPTATITLTYTPTRTLTPSATATPAPPTLTATWTPTATWTITPTFTVTPTYTPTRTATSTPLPPLHIDVTPFPGLATPPCFIFLHGKRGSADTANNWSLARSYWQSGANDFIRTATKEFAASFYVIGYNGSQPYWHAEAAGDVANEIVNATNGGPDGGGNTCARTWAQGGTFWVIGHSMGGAVINYILGNAHPSDPNYNQTGPFDVAAQRISLAITLAGTHRGSQGADAVCDQGNPLCSFIAGFIDDCDSAAYWLRSSDEVQVRTFTGTPARAIWLTSGYAAIPGSSLCLAGEDDGLVQFASAYACGGSATTSYNMGNVCGHASKQKSWGFFNLDAAHDTHDQIRNGAHADTRKAIPDGVWICNGSRCSPDSTVQGGMSTAEMVSRLW